MCIYFLYFEYYCKNLVLLEVICRLYYCLQFNARVFFIRVITKDLRFSMVNKAEYSISGPTLCSVKLIGWQNMLIGYLRRHD